MKKQHTNVSANFGTKVVPCVDGSGEKGVLKDACTRIKAWSSDPVHIAAGHNCPSLPRIVQYAQSIWRN